MLYSFIHLWYLVLIRLNQQNENLLADDHLTSRGANGQKPQCIIMSMFSETKTFLCVGKPVMFQWDSLPLFPFSGFRIGLLCVSSSPTLSDTSGTFKTLSPDEEIKTLWWKEVELSRRRWCVCQLAPITGDQCWWITGVEPAAWIRGIDPLLSTPLPAPATKDPEPWVRDRKPKKAANKTIRSQAECVVSYYIRNLAKYVHYYTRIHAELCCVRTITNHTDVML